MSKIPIRIEKIKVNESRFSNLKTEVVDVTKYLVKIEEKGLLWERTYVCGRGELIKLRDAITEIIDKTTTAETLEITNEKAKIVDDHYKTDELCKSCSFKLTRKCVECLFVLQSPLERKLFLALSRSYIKFQTQYALNWKGENISIEGKTFESQTNNFKNVLTVVDFYIEKSQTKLCIYTDGHTYHERTEEQAQHDRNIDRKLQGLGFKVLRYTGKEVNEGIETIIDDINKWNK